MSNSGDSSATRISRVAHRESLVVATGRADGLEPTVVLVEGHSDKVALETLARRRGRDLAGERIYIVAMGGATNVGQYLDVFGPAGINVELAGLYDAGEEATIRRGLMRAGLGKDLPRGDIEELGFFRCDVDLEDELIRALGTVAVEEVIGAQGELGSFRTFQNQPAQRGRPAPQQLRRFMGTRSGRKARYASLLVEALDLERVPRPLDRVLTAPGNTGGQAYLDRLATRSDHLGSSTTAKYIVNQSGVDQCHKLIDARQYVVRSEWGDVQPSAEDENAYLESHDWEEYAAWHLGLTEGASDETKARYGFVYGDFRRVHRMGLIACLYRAAQWEHKQIELAAHDLLQHLDMLRGIG